MTIVNEAVTQGTAGEFEKELEIANHVLEYFPDNEEASKAADSAEKAIVKRDSLEELEDFIDDTANYDDDVLEYIDSPDFDVIVDILVDTNPIIQEVHRRLTGFRVRLTVPQTVSGTATSMYVCAKLFMTEREFRIC